MNPLLKFFLSFLIPLFAHTQVEVFVDNPVRIQWQNYGEEYEYMIEINQLKQDTKTEILKSDWSLDSNLEVEITEESSYEWNLYIKEVGKDCDGKYQCFNIESGYFDFYFSKVEDDSNQEAEDVIEEQKESSKKEKSTKKEQEVLGASENKYVTKKNFIKDEKETVEKTKEAKDISEKIQGNSCRYSYNIKKKRFKLIGCDIDIPTINSSEYYKYKNNYIIDSKGKYPDRVKIYINNIVCKKFDIFNTKTWFNCEEVVISSEEYDIDLKHEVYFYNKKVISPTNYIFKDKDFEISTLVNQLPNSLVFKSYFSLEHKNSWLDQEFAIKIPISFSESKLSSLYNQNAPYEFPFSKIIHVNQWHGCTDYKCPHSGIDFAAVKENIYASDNGIVIAKGYDTYYGECSSGGKYLVIKYDSGHHMAYFHLEKSLVSKNQKVKKGELIAISGNSGAYNCQPLGYHLHFELRNERKQSSHIDPVPYIDINWALVKTNMSNRFPKRLSGDNPHPNY